MTGIAKSRRLILFALIFCHPRLAVRHDTWVEITPATEGGFTVTAGDK
jgi:hypothetical protein